MLNDVNYDSLHYLLTHNEVLLKGKPLPDGAGRRSHTLFPRKSNPDLC